MWPGIAPTPNENVPLSPAKGQHELRATTRASARGVTAFSLWKCGVLGP
jgi:hypothetical protein